MRDCIAAAPDSALGPDGVRASACGACVDRATPASIRAAQWILDFGEIQDRLDEPIITRIPKKALPHETRHIARELHDLRPISLGNNDRQIVSQVEFAAL